MQYLEEALYIVENAGDTGCWDIGCKEVHRMWVWERRLNQMTSLLIFWGPCSFLKYYNIGGGGVLLFSSLFYSSSPSFNAVIPNILKTEVLLDCNSQKPLPLAVLSEISGCCSPKTPGYPWLGATYLKDDSSYLSLAILCRNWKIWIHPKVCLDNVSAFSTN